MLEINVTRPWGQRRGPVMAELRGSFWRQAPTSKEAVKAVEEAVTEQAEHLFTRRYVHTNGPEGEVFCLYYADGWTYDISRPGQYTPSIVMLTERTQTEAWDAMIRHIDSTFGGVKAGRLRASAPNVNRIVVEIEDGCLRSVRAREPVEVVLIDWDCLPDEYDWKEPTRALADLAARYPWRAEALRLTGDGDRPVEVDQAKFPVEAW